MKNYEILKTKLYDSIILSLLKRNIISLDEAFGCLKDINKENKPPIDLNKDLSMVKHKGLTNPITGKKELEDVNYE